MPLHFNNTIQIKSAAVCTISKVRVCLIVPLLIPFVLCAQEDTIDSFIKKNLQSLHIPGASFVVAKNGNIIKSGSYGLSNIELGVPASPKTVFEIGSMTKQFTAMSIMMLEEEGKLDLNNPITRYFPDAPSRWKQITIRHLLTHTSGIQNHVAVPGYLGVFKTNLFNESFPGKKEILKLFYQLPQEFTPGQTWAYDNTGYHLLGFIIEQITKQSYWTFLQNRIFRPLGMTNTRNTDTKDLVYNRATGYIWQDSIYKNQPPLWPFVGFSAGSLLSTVEDLALWDAALYTEKLVKKGTHEKMWQPAKTNEGSLLPYNSGFGWFIDSYHGHRIVQHSGGTPGFSSVIYRFPHDTLCVVILTNHADAIIDHLALDIAGIYQPELKRPMAINDSSPALTTRLKTIFSQLIQGHYNQSEFTPAMNVFLKTSTSKSLWQWFASFGKMGTFHLADHERKDGMDSFRYRVQLGENIYLFTISLRKDGKIAQIYFS
jgi:D-alanyl-D-alanine carboxypeptidase